MGMADGSDAKAGLVTCLYKACCGKHITMAGGNKCLHDLFTHNFFTISSFASFAQQRSWQQHP